MILVRPGLGWIESKAFGQRQPDPGRGEFVVGRGLVGVDRGGPRYHAHLLRCQAVPGDDVVPAPRAHHRHYRRSVTKSPVSRLSLSEVERGEELGQVEVLQIVRRIDGRHLRPEACLLYTSPSP